MTQPTRFEDNDDNNDQKKAAEKKEGTPQASTTLYKSRIVIISGEVNQKLAERVSSQLLAMDQENQNPITLFLNSQGGHVEAGDTIHDVVRFIRSPVRIIGTGWVASAGVTILLSAPKERRVCLPNTRFLIHQPSGGARGQASDIQIEATEIQKMRKRLNELIAKETGQDFERVKKDTDRDTWFSADEAIEYGLISRVVQQAGELD